MNKKSFASTIIAVILVCPVLAVTHTFTPTDIESLKVKICLLYTSDAADE